MKQAILSKEFETGDSALSEKSLTGEGAMLTTLIKQILESSLDRKFQARNATRPFWFV